MKFQYFGVIIMKKNKIYIIIALSVFILAGCKSNNDQETYFIPTMAPEIIEDEWAYLDELLEDDEEENEETTNEEEPTNPITIKYVKLSSAGTSLNVRSAPSATESTVVGTLKHADSVEVISIENGWASINYNGQTCYVSAEFLVDDIPSR